MSTRPRSTADLAINSPFDLDATASLRRWSGAFGAWRVRRDSIAELNGLDDASLRDIGVNRGEIAALVDQRMTGVRFAKRT